MNLQDKTMAQEGAKMEEVTSITNEDLMAAVESAESPGSRNRLLPCQNIPDH